jgi:asparagine synthase (glutamine-hydrolysing)
LGVAIAGACRVSGEGPAPSEFDLDRSLAAMRLAGGRVASVWRTGGVFGRVDGGLIAERDDRLVLFDGRLDNRPDLLAMLPAGEGPAFPSDAELVLRAQARWGDDFPDRLIGDFACAVWDGTARRLMLARDALGAVGLYFWREDETLCFATEPRGLLAQPRIPKAVDEQWIARWLALLPQGDTRTQYRGIERVPPGQVVLHDRDGIRLRRTWRPETLAPLRLARNEDYAAGLRAVLDEAIRCRVGVSGRIGSHLSGGFDSAGVTASAARLLAGSGRRLTAFTAVPTGAFDPDALPDRLGDEGPLAAETARMFPNIDHVLIPNQAMPLFDAVDAAGLAMDGPVLNPSNQVWLNAIGRAAQARGIGTMLTGQAGNMTISYDGLSWLPQLVLQGRWLRLLRELRALHRTGSPWLRLANQSIGPLLPLAFRDWLLALAGRPPITLGDFSALDAAFAGRVGVGRQAWAMAGDVSRTPLDRRDVRLAVLARQDPAPHRRGFKRQFGIDLVDPTADRRVVEFCLAVPPEQFLRQGETRSLLRRAMAGILPEAVLGERRRGLQSADWHHGMTAARDEIAMEIARLERSPLGAQCLDLERLRRMVEDWPTGGWHSTGVRASYSLALARGIATGRFIRQVEGGNA